MNYHAPGQLIAFFGVLTAGAHCGKSTSDPLSPIERPGASEDHASPMQHPPGDEEVDGAGLDSEAALAGHRCSVPIGCCEGTGCVCCTTDSLSPKLLDSPSCQNQQGVNCFAWQAFIALNWPQSDGQKPPPPSSFGKATKQPEDFYPVVWQSFIETSQLFAREGYDEHVGRAGAEHEDCSVADFPLLSPLQNAQRPWSPLQADGYWLADVNGNLVWYEVRVNQVQQDYVVNNGLTSAAGQLELVQKSGLTVPDGAIEIKAGWREIVDVSQYSQYFMRSACVAKAGGGLRRAQLGLSALHIIHKTKSGGQRWLWSTFEHKDNAPDADNPDPDDKSYAFYDKDCKPRSIDPSCLAAGSSNTVYNCDGQPPPYGLLDYFEHGEASRCPPFPIQVTRKHPIPEADSNPVRQLNEQIKLLIVRDAGATSVFANYRLINTMWTTGLGSVVQRPSETAPLDVSSMQPNWPPVANTVLETYEQAKHCTECHKDAVIAGSSTLASDYSFVFDDAQ